MSDNRDIVDEIVGIVVFVIWIASATIATFSIVTIFNNVKRDLDWRAYATEYDCVKVNETSSAFAIASTGVMVYNQGKEMWRCSGNNTIHYRDK